MRNLFFLVACFAVLVVPGLASAQQCGMSRKSITFKVTMCSQRGCSTGAETLNFVGDKVVHYQELASREGTIYKIGATVDFCDSRSESYRPSLCRNEFGPMKAHGTARFVGPSLTLQLVQEYTVRSVPARTTQIMRVEIPTCSSCRVVQVLIEAATLDGRLRDVTQMAGPQAEFCTVR